MKLSSEKRNDKEEGGVCMRVDVKVFNDFIQSPTHRKYVYTLYIFKSDRKRLEDSLQGYRYVYR